VCLYKMYLLAEILLSDLIYIKNIKKALVIW